MNLFTGSLYLFNLYIFYFFVYKFTSSVAGPNVTRRRARDSILVFSVFLSSFCNTACFHMCTFLLRLFRYYLCFWCGPDSWCSYVFLFVWRGIMIIIMACQENKKGKSRNERRDEVFLVKALKWNKPHYDCMRAYYCIIVRNILA